MSTRRDRLLWQREEYLNEVCQLLTLWRDLDASRDWDCGALELVKEKIEMLREEMGSR